MSDNKGNQESVGRRRFLLGDFHKVGCEKGGVGKGKQSPENFWGSCFLKAREQEGVWAEQH